MVSPISARIEDVTIRPTMLGDGDAYGRFMISNIDRFRPSMPTIDLNALGDDHWAEVCRNAVEHADAGRALKFLLVTNSGQVIGDVTYSNIVMGAFQSCYLGYKIDTGHEGRGLMRRALEVLNAHMFAERGLHRIMANYRPENERSGGLLKRLGFTIEGHARDYLFLDGAWRDHVLTSKIAEAPAKAERT